MAKVYAVRVGDKFGPEFEEYFKSKLPDITFINDSPNPFIKQWNKIRLFNLDVDEPICVIDVDIELINDYVEMFEFPIERGEFVHIDTWWNDSRKFPHYRFNGGFYKFYPKDTKYIYDKWMSDPEYWMQHYISNGTTIGPVNGEQYFVEDSVRERLNPKPLPKEWCTLWGDWDVSDQFFWNECYPGDFLNIGGEFNEDIKLIHWSGQKDCSAIRRTVQ